MTRYSRSVIPGRPQEGEGDASLERAVFGAKKRPIAPPANDREDYSDPLDMDLDEAGHLVDRPERRKADDRRKPNAERRKASDRRSSDFPPLRENGVNYRTADDGKRGPILLIGALVIVAVFGVVVWSAYRDGVKGDDPEAAAPQLASAGAFKTPPLEVKDAPLASGLPSDSLDQLDGGPSPVGETRPEPVIAPPPAAVAPAPPPARAIATPSAPPPSKVIATPPAPAPSKVMAPPPAPLKTPAVPAQALQATPKPAAPVEVAVAMVAPAPVASKPASPPVQLPKPAPTPTPAAGPAAAPVAAPPEASAFKPAFAAGGTWIAQIAAASSEPGAIAEWNRRAKAMPEFFSGAERFVVQADVNGKTVYRLRAGPFGSKADADAFCSAFKAKGGNCFPATK